MSEHLPDTNYLDPEVLQRLGDRRLWDNSLVVPVLVALLGFEWILRSKFDLR